MHTCLEDALIIWVYHCLNALEMETCSLASLEGWSSKNRGERNEGVVSISISKLGGGF